MVDVVEVEEVEAWVSRRYSSAEQSPYSLSCMGGGGVRASPSAFCAAL